MLAHLWHFPSGCGDPGGRAAADGPAEGAVVELCGGRYHTCARTRDGEVYCWGQGAYRQLGGDYGFQGTPRRIEGLEDALAIECGHRFGCAIRTGDAVSCWGDDDHGQAGPAETVPCGDSTIDSVCVTTPQPVPSLPSGVAGLALDEDHACVLRSDGSVACWGDNAAGQVGTPDPLDIGDPRPVEAIAGATQAVAGDRFSCALLGSPGPVMCWGANNNAQLGNGSTAEVVSQPGAVVDLDDATQLVAGGEHACAIRADRTVVCWGYNYLASLGNGSTRPTRASRPEVTLVVTDAVQLAAGRYHSCALRDGGQVLCWGDNLGGQLGNGEISHDPGGALVEPEGLP
jgi:alpha-tubulin suppressor-like RCC1 family protein